MSTMKEGSVRADARRKRQQIIEAATERFRRRSSSETTLEGIAKDAGVGIATLYRHFPSRADLRLACALNFIDTLRGFLDETLETFDDDPEAHWEGFVWRLVDYGVGALVWAFVDGQSQGVGPEVTDKRDQFFADVEVLLDKASDHGLVNPALGPLEMASELIVVTRPQGQHMDQLFPDVQKRLVGHLLAAWRQA